VIREMTRVAHENGAFNLAQGFPDFEAPEVLKEAACAAIRADVNQYAVTWGAPRLRRALGGEVRARLRHGGGRGTRDHRDLRRDRSHGLSCSR
jgi:aspartate/methionine/tyrosine aminotransferase